MLEKFNPAPPVRRVLGLFSSSRVLFLLHSITFSFDLVIMSEDPTTGTKRFGFQLKGTTKRQRVVESEKPVEVDIITAIEDSNINSIKPTKGPELLVIPLCQPKYAQHEDPPVVKVEPKQTQAKTLPPQKIPNNKLDAPSSSSLDQEAAAELIAELYNTDPDAESTGNLLVIKQDPVASATDTASASAADGDLPQKKKKAPLLMLNVAPELLNITNETERFKYDVSSRADDLNVRSEIYEAIPVSQFGAALLRGMGWTGPDASTGAGAEGAGKRGAGADPDKIVPRENRLGLGAQARPPEPVHGGAGGGAGGGGGKYPSKHGMIVGDKSRGPAGSSGSSSSSSDAAKKAWEAKAEQRVRSQKLQDGDFVWLRAPADLAGRRALVVQARGVPGLDRIR
jgi:hypothetical protein